MKTETVWKRIRELETETRDLWHRAEHYGLTSTDVHRQFCDALERKGTLPQWARWYVRGYERALSQGAYERSLIYGGFIDGTFYSVHKDRADYYSKFGIDPRTFHDNATGRGHYWPNLKPFFVGE